MEERSIDLQDECWEMIFNRVDPGGGDWESISLVCKRFLSIVNSLKVSFSVFSPSIQILSRLLRRFSCLKKIELLSFRGDLNKAVILIAQSGLDLEELDLSYNHSLPEVCLEELGSNMRNMKVLKCSGSSMTDADLVGIGNFFPGLEELEIRDSYFPREGVDGKLIAVTDEGIHFISKKLKRLRRIDLSGNQCISDGSLVFLSSNCAFLEKIAVRYCRVTEKGISYILQNTHHLNSLVVSAHFKLESFGVRVSASFAKNLQSLCFGSIHISDESLYSITQASIPLREFKLVFCKGYTFTGISSLLNSYQSLEHLVLYGAEFLTDEQIEHVSRFLSNLTSLHLHNCPELSDSAFVMLVQRCPLLSHLEMGGTSIGREEYNYDNLNKNFAITSLGLRSNSYLSSYGLGRLLNIFPNIEKLDLSNSFQREEQLDIADILGCSNGIKSLQLSVCQRLKFSIKDAEVSNLQRLTASHSGISDEELRMIGKNCPNLMHLDLLDCEQVTKEGVKEVVISCKRLRFLSLSACCNVESDIAAWIVSNRPSLRRFTTPAHLYPEEQEQKWFQQGGCLVSRGVDYDEFV